uniref:ATP-dependent Clp protease proteolytic subunit n=1 Tax=Araucaria cunninghamii TaxID=56994 RepID=A0A0D6QWR6_ARACU
MATLAVSAGFTSCESQWRGKPLMGFGKGSMFGTQGFIMPFQFCNNRKKPQTLVTTAAKSPADKVPRQFREENLKEGVMENFKNFPQQLYGLSPSQFDFFTAENSPVQRQAGRVTEESLSSAKYYMEGPGMSSRNIVNGPSRSLGSFRTGRLSKMPRTPPPDLPSVLLASRIVFIGMPLVPVVTELIHAQLMYLDAESSEPINIYINSAGTLNEKGESIALDNDAFAIADAIMYCNCRIFTLNLGKAFGHAAMLLALGHPGCRYLLPHAFTRIYLPSVNQSVGPSIDMYLQAKELERSTNKYIHFLTLGTDKSHAEISNDLKKGQKLFLAQQAIDYGLADKIMPMKSDKLLAEARTYGKKLDPAKAAEMKAARASPSAGAAAPPAGRP